MKENENISVLLRAAALLSLWLATPLFWNLMIPDSGEFDSQDRLWSVPLAPLVVAISLEYLCMGNSGQGLIALPVLALFLGQALIMLTRSKPRAFLAWTIVLVILLIGSSVAVLYAFPRMAYDC